MEIKVYTKARCPHCTSAKAWLRQHSLPFVEVSLDDEVARTQFRADHPKLKTVPQIFHGDRHIGGFSDLIRSDLDK